MENPGSLLPILGLTNLGRTLLGEKGTKSPVGLRWTWARLWTINTSAHLELWVPRTQTKVPDPPSCPSLGVPRAAHWPPTPTRARCCHWVMPGSPSPRALAFVMKDESACSLAASIKDLCHPARPSLGRCRRRPQYQPSPTIAASTVSFPSRITPSSLQHSIAFLTRP
jgi:hypothetical protein